MLDIIYFSNVTNNTHRFVQKLNWEWGTAHRIPLRNPETFTAENPHILMCPSYGDVRRAHVPPQVRKFLSNPDNRKHTVGVIGTGNMNFAEEYGYAGYAIAEKLQVPYLYRLELAGTTEDVENVHKLISKFVHDRSQQSNQNAS